MIVAVTGGSGFVGRHLVKAHLDRGDEVRVLTRDASMTSAAEAKLFLGDLAGEAVPRHFVDGADILYHCAGEIRDPSRMQAVHVGGTRKLIQLASGCVKRWVQLSSVGVYGRHRAGVVTESAVIAPRGIYERTKAESDRLVADAHEQGRIEAVIVRPSIIFGPTMQNRSLFQLIAAIDKRRFFFIGPTGASANYVPVQNVVAALRLCASHPAAVGEVFNISDFRTLEDFIGTIARALGREPPRVRLPQEPLRMIAAMTSWLPRWPLTAARIDALTSRCRYPTEKIELLLGYRRQVLVEDALCAMVKQWQDGRDKNDD